MRRGQAAIEFLMTYGWALLIILVAISALVYFGILNADRFLPERCDLPTGIACLSFKLTDDDLTLVIQNNLGEDITFRQIALMRTRNSTLCSTNYTSFGGSLINGDKNTYTISNCEPGIEGQKFKGLIKLLYDDEETIQRSRTGELVATIEEVQ